MSQEPTTQETPPNLPPAPMVAVAPGRRRPFTSGEIISWLIVLAVVAFIAISVGIEQRREADAGEATNETQLVLSAKYGIGVNALFRLPETDTQLLAQLDDAAKTQPDKLRVAIVAGELRGAEEALRRLDALASEKNDLQEDLATAQAYYRDPPLPEAQAFNPEMPAASEPAATDPRDAKRREAFQKKWGFFGDVAEAYAKPPMDPAREKMLSTSYRVVAAILAVVVLGGGAGVIGLVLLITGIVLFAKGRLKPAYGSVSSRMPALPANRETYIEAFAIYLAMMIGAGFVLRRVLHLPDMVAAAIALALMPIGVLLSLLWPRIRGGTWGQWRAAFGIHTGRGLFREVFAGFVGYLAGIPLMIIGICVMLVLVKIANVQPSHPITNSLEQGGILMILLVFVAASIWAPLSEELLFRGALFTHLRERWRPVMSGVVVGLIFALVHPQGWPLVPVLGTIGFNFAMIREWRGSIIACITAHAIHNTLTLIFALTILR